jgi:hypothetical protein
MRGLARTIAALGDRRAALEAQLAAASTDAGAHERLAELGIELASVASDLDQAEDEWLTLAAEAEERGLEVDG